MKGDFSRLRFDRAKNYTSVLAQQGRVQLDADANEQRAIDEFLRATGLTDIIGRTGTPKHDAGFAVTTDGNSIHIGAGRYYVEGVLCEAARSFDYMSQPWLLEPQPSAATLLANLRLNPTGTVQVWLEAWRRLVTPIDDPGIKDVALGEADTTDRLQTVWRVVAEAAAAPSGNVTCCAAMHLPRPAVLPGLLTAGTQDASGQGTCLPSPHAAYRGLENQLYRVEVHEGGPLAQATFKWSRDNGSVVTRITNVSGSVVTVDSLGPDANLGFQPLQWVEITDDSNEFGQEPNQPGQLIQIVKLGPGPLDITLAQTAPAVDTVNGHAKLRRWDQTGTTATAAGVAINPSGQNPLENGIYVQFAQDRPVRSGDYWLIPARTATGVPEWPPSDSDGAEYQPARNIPIFRAPLACIHFDANAGAFRVDSCRDVFSPLTELTPPAIPPALHVTAINWPNDDIYTLDQLLFLGLIVTLDGPAAAAIDAASFILKLEIPIPTNSFEAEANFARVVGGGIGLLRYDFILDGSVAVDPIANTLSWTVGRSVFSYLLQVTDSLVNQANQGQFIRARVRLTGRTIRGADPSTPLYLDGQCFGSPATSASGDARTNLSLPSGNEEKASDFESWFYVAPVQRIDSMTITPAAVAFVVVRSPLILNRFLLRLVDNTSGQPSASSPAVSPTLTLALHYNAVVDTTVSLSVTPATGIVQVPPTVVVPRGAAAPASPVPVTVANTGTTTAQTFTITASLTLPSGLQTSASATISVTGAVPPNPVPVPVFTPITPALR